MTASAQLPKVGTELKAATAELEAGPPGSECLVKIGGDWRLSEPVPLWAGVLGKRTAASVRVKPEDLGKWDTSLVLFLVHGQVWCAKAKKDFHAEALPKNLQALLRQVAGISEPKPTAKTDAKSGWVLARDMAKMWASHATENVSFIGECALGFMGAAKNPRRFRWTDCLFEMQQCWATSLPIVSVVSFLVGVILAFQAAIQLRQFGAAVYVADLVGLAVVREMGPMMASMIVAGGTGAGFAAQLGNMKVGEEIDALETLGVSAVDCLALHRLLAVTLMMPVLAAYANVLGVLGGMFVSVNVLDIPAAAYWAETQASVGVLDVTTGLIKSIFFGMAVGFAGCLRGMKCERSAAGVGAATSSAVVTGVILIVLADALFGTIYTVRRI